MEIRLSNALPALYFIWTGLILGVSFIATPLKFLAPHLTLPVALEVGQVTLHFFNYIEWGLIVLAILFSFAGRFSVWKWGMLVSIFLALSLQTFWLFPELDVRTELVMAGQPRNPDNLHGIFIIIEFFKAVMVFIGGCTIRERKSVKG
ncbi:hypothetical protein [Emcibacter sp.]|uniref:hypothetical protein n=1 Tax=Emcibacter sp. TaxID=1979954 RepID=UPI003A8E71FD